MTGYVAANIAREQVERLQAQPQTARMNMKIVEYRRGVFSSDVVTSFTLPDELPEIGQPQFIMENKLRHGPLLFANGISAGWFSSTSTIRVKTNAPEFDQKIVEIFGPSIGKLTTLGYFNNTYDVRWNLPAIEYKAAAATFSLADSNMDCEGGYKDLSGNCRFTLGRIEATGVDGSKLTIAPLVGSANSRNVEEGVDLVDMDMNIAGIDVQSTAKPPVSIKGISIRQTQKLVGPNIDSSVKFSLASLSGPVQVDNFHYDMDFNGVSKQAIKRLTAMSAEMPIDPAQQNTYLATQMKEILPLLLQDSLVIKLDTGAQYLGAHPQAQWLVQYKAPADGRDVRTITDPIDYLQLADSTLLARLPVSLIPEPLVAPYIDSHITRDGNDYVLRATLKNGILTIGKTQIPRETLVALFAQKDQQPPQADAAQRKPVRKRAP